MTDDNTKPVIPDDEPCEVCGSTVYVYHDWGTRECCVCRAIYDPVPGGWERRKVQP